MEKLLVRVKTVKELIELGYIVDKKHECIVDTSDNSGFFLKYCGKCLKVDLREDMALPYSFEIAFFKEKEVEIISTKLAKILYASK
jgi:hypothetical protein